MAITAVIARAMTRARGSAACESTKPRVIAPAAATNLATLGPSSSNAVKSITKNGCMISSSERIPLDATLDTTIAARIRPETSTTRSTRIGVEQSRDQIYSCGKVTTGGQVREDLPEARARNCTELSHAFTKSRTLNPSKL